MSNEQNLPAQQNEGSMTNQLKPIDMSGDVPDLADADEMPIDLNSEYWTPEKEGEHKLVFFDCVQQIEKIDEDTGETEQARAVYFIEKVDGKLKRIYNQSIRLVSIFAENNIPAHTAFKITYLGKKKNKNNSFSSDHWSVTPLRVSQ